MRVFFTRFIPEHNKYTRGFTLMEIIIVMAIMAIIISAGFASFKSSQMKGRDAKRKSDLRAISTALEAYYNDKGQFPADTGANIYGCGANGTAQCTWGTSVFSDTTTGTIYMILLPKDSKATQKYYYDTSANYTSYQLYARLENTQDIDVPKNGAGVPLGYGGTGCQASGTAVLCNYGVSSSNTTPATNHTPQ